MASHNKQSTQFDISELVVEKRFPVASHDPYGEDDEALEKRREERRKRKKEKRRERMLPEEEGDPDTLLGQPKKQKRKKQKKARPELWYDDSLDEKEAFDEALEYDDGRKSRSLDDDWYDEWDS